MKFKKVTSFLCSLALSVSVFAGLTAVMASAEDEPDLADLVLMEKYSDNFSEWTRDSNKKLDSYDTTNWTATGTVKLNDNNYPELNPGTISYSNTFTSDALYYKYQIRMTNFDTTVQSVSLIGADGDTAVLTSPLTDNSKYYTFTTAVIGNKAYTYNQDGTLNNTISFTGNATGIKFENTKGNLLIQSFSSGKIADVPELSSYTFLDASYTAPFSTWTQNSGGTALDEYDSTNWEQSGRTGINSSKLVQAKSASGDLAAGALTFKNTASSDKFYYEYDVRLATAACELSLQTSSGDNAVVLATPYNGDLKNSYKYTTVVDGNIAYTYDKDSKAVTATEFTGTATGLKFASKGGEVLIKSFSYGKVIDPPALSDYALTEIDKPNFSTWTADSGDNTLTSYDTENWIGSGRLGVTSDKQAQIKAATGDYTDGVLTYNKAADSGVFYYNYKVRMTDKTSNRNSISLAGVDAVVLTSPLDSDGSGTYEFTTVVDGNMAYTYNADGKLVKVVEFTGKVTGLTFKSTSGQEIRIKEISFGKVYSATAEWVGAFNASGSYTPSSNDDKIGSDLATAYSADFTFDTATSYTNPSVKWSFEFSDTAPEVGEKNITTDYDSFRDQTEVKYGLVVTGAALTEGDASVTATLQQGTN